MTTTDRSNPDVPLTHADPAEHRRLLAIKANSVGVEIGKVTPTATFATVGDVSPSYTTQSGDYWRYGILMHFSFYILVTLTFSTASGALQIGGLPYECDSGGISHSFPVRLVATNITFPSGYTQAIGYIGAGNSYANIFLTGSTKAGADLSASDITSGTSIGIYGTGLYPIAQQ